MALMLGCAPAEQGEAGDRGAAVEAAVSETAVMAAVIASPASGDTVDAAFTLMLETRNVELRPAGTMEPGTGHHHLFIDRAIVPVDTVIPAAPGIVHLGAAQREYTYDDLAPGPHVIIAVLGDHEHRRIAGALTDTIQFIVR
jgi:hypothetical protein